MDCCNKFGVIRCTVDVGYNMDCRTVNSYNKRMITLYTNTFYETTLVWDEIKGLMNSQDSIILPETYSLLDRIHSLDPSIEFRKMYPTYKKERFYFNAEYPAKEANEICYNYKRLCTFFSVYYKQDKVEEFAKFLIGLLNKYNFKLLDYHGFIDHSDFNNFINFLKKEEP